MLARYYFLRQIRFLYCCFVCLCVCVSFFWVVLLTAFHKNYVAISFTFVSAHKFCSSSWKPQKLWLHFSSLITSPHAPFIYPLNWKKVIGLETVLTCFVGYSSENHSSGIPFSYKRIQFPVEVLGWVGDFTANSSDCSQRMPCRCCYQVGLLETTCKTQPLHKGDMVSSWNKDWENRFWDWAIIWAAALKHARIFTNEYCRFQSAQLWKGYNTCLTGSVCGVKKEKKL